MAEKKPDDAPAEQPQDVAAAEREVLDSGATMAAERDAYRAEMTALALDDSPEARESAVKMHEQIAKATEAHEQRLEKLSSHQTEALQKLDTEHYLAKPWKGMMRYQCAHCYRDASSEALIKEHLAQDHKSGFGPVVMDRNGEPLAAETKE